MDSEHQAYHTLIDDGGRASHPLDTHGKFLVALGKYPDIMTSWQRSLDEWQVFTTLDDSGLRLWKAPWKFQLHMRSFSDSVNKVEPCLISQRGFAFSQVFKPGGPPNSAKTRVDGANRRVGSSTRS